MIVVDTGGLIALLDADDKHHEAVASNFEDRGDDWVLPRAILPEVDDLAATRLGEHVARAICEDLKAGVFTVEADLSRDLSAAWTMLKRSSKLNFGLRSPRSAPPVCWIPTKRVRGGRHPSTGSG